MIGVLIIALYSMLIRDMDKGVLPYPGIAGRFCSDDPPSFGDYRSNCFPILCLITLTTSVFKIKLMFLYCS